MSAYTEGRDLALMFKYHMTPNKTMTYNRKFFDWLAGYRRDLLHGEFREKLVDYITERDYESLILLTPEELKQKIKYDGFGGPINDYDLDELIFDVHINTLNEVFMLCEPLLNRAKELYKDFEDYQIK
jgi:hypothetical protein